MIDFFILRYVGLCVIMKMSSLYFLWLFYFCLLFLIIKVVSLPSALIVYPLNLILDGVLVMLELLYAELIMTLVLLSLGP